MQKKELEQLILQLENYLECWKQFNQFVNVARSKKFGPEEENQFLEVKSVIVQELEIILASIASGTPPTSRQIWPIVAKAAGSATKAGSAHASVNAASSSRHAGTRASGMNRPPNSPK